MSFQHHDVAEHWSQMTVIEQLANIGSEVGRALTWQEKGNHEYQDLAFWRALELLDLTIQCHTDSPATLTELTRLKETLGDYFKGENLYKSSPELWNRYFYYFNYRAAILRGR
jgi:hypothetical protein